LDHALAEQGRGRQPAQRHRLDELDVEIDRTRQPDRLLELGVAAALIRIPKARAIGTEHRSDRGGSRRLVRSTLALVVSVTLEVLCQISLRLCLRRTTGPA